MPGTVPVPPPIDGVRRSYVDARGVRFHVTEAGDPDGLPILCLHGWPQHHLGYRDLLADPPAGLRIIAPDLPGYGWSGPAPHRWEKEEVAQDLLALLDALGLERVGLVGHDWGGYIGHLLVLGAPQRFTAYLALNIAHPWNTPRTLAPHLWRFLLYQPVMAAFGRPLQQRTGFLHLLFRIAVKNREAFGPADAAVFVDRFRDPVCARTGQATYRTFLLHELPRLGREPEQRRSTVPTVTLFGDRDTAIDASLAAAETAQADDYRLKLVPGAGHFIADERPDLVRAEVLALFAPDAP